MSLIALDRKKSPLKLSGLFREIDPAASYFRTPERCSIVGSSRLNCRVRDGRLTRSIHPYGLPAETGAIFASLVDPSGLALKVSVESAQNHSRVFFPRIVQSKEVPSVDRQ